MSTKLKNYFGSSTGEKKAGVFCIAFLINLIVMQLFAATSNGLYTYFGDYNLQQIPFYYHVHELVRNGSLGWDFATDLGSDVFESYTFYLLGSPFFWLTIPFPNAALPYLMPWLYSLKIGLAALFAYIYIRQFVQNTNTAVLGGIVYAYSGFQLYNLLFNHFHDPYCLFPLLLLASDKMFMEGKKGFFAAMVGLCACTNYFFFAQMVVFTVIYFAVNIICKRYTFKFGRFVNYALESVLGVCCAAVILLPAFKAVFSSSRSGELINSDFLVYDEWEKYFFIFKSFFTFTDIPLHTYLKTSVELSESSLSAYLPYVSMCGVIGYFVISRGNKKDVFKLLTIVSLVFMAVPVLNASFSMFNAQYYARWYFAPILIFSCMTACCADKDVRAFRAGLIPCTVIPFIISGFYFVHELMQDGADLTAAANTISYPLCQCVLPMGCMMTLYAIFNDKSLDSSEKIVNAVLIRTCVVCLFSCLIIIGYVYGIVYDRTKRRDYYNSFVASREAVEPLREDTFFRVDGCSDYTNTNLMWNMGADISFNSLVNPSINAVMEKIGFPRGTNSYILPNYYAYRCLLSVKYYFDRPYVTETNSIEQYFEHPVGLDIFTYKDTLSKMWVYENECYIPMGFTFDKYMTDEDFTAIDTPYFKIQSLLDALVLTEEQADRFSDILTRYDTADSKYDLEGLRSRCADKAASSCEYFHTDNKGFEAKFTGSKDELLFFSVPYDKGWKCTINGQAAPIEKVSYGFMAVRTAPGENIIRFDYHSSTVTAGLIITLVSIGLLGVYIIISKKRN